MLARAARRLSQSGAIRGLGDALADGGAAGSSGRQLTSPRALAAAAADGGGSATGPSSPPPALGLGQASASSSAEGAAQAAPRVPPPPGHTDFQRRQLLMMFTCNKCNTRAAKAFSKQSYETGVVIVECPGCSSKHLIADHLGWFGQKGTVEEFAAERGSTVLRRMADGTLELTPEEVLGQSLVQEAAAAATAAAAAAGGAPSNSGGSGLAAAGEGPAAAPGGKRRGK